MNLNYPFTPRDKKLQTEVFFPCYKNSFRLAALTCWVVHCSNSRVGFRDRIFKIWAFGGTYFQSVLCKPSLLVDQVSVFRNGLFWVIGLCQGTSILGNLALPLSCTYSVGLW